MAVDVKAIILLGCAVFLADSTVRGQKDCDLIRQVTLPGMERRTYVVWLYHVCSMLFNFLVGQHITAIFAGYGSRFGCVTVGAACTKHLKTSTLSMGSFWHPAVGVP
jgi:hypothetical protein